jgi:hypothetical protein
VPAPISSITQENAESLIHSGYLPVMAITASTANQYDYLFLIGRNEDSGSRLNVYAEAQAGVGQAAVQWMPSYTGSPASYTDAGASAAYISTTGSNVVYDGGTTATLAGLQKWPANWALNTNTTISWTTAGHSGFVSGGEVASALEAINPITSGSISITSGPTTPSKVYVIGYVGTADANSALTTGTSATNNGATELKYNGTLYSQAAVKNGAYSLWGYEHALYNSSLESGDKLQAIDDIADTVYQTTASYNSSLTPVTDRTAAGIIEDSTVLFSRGKEGGVITQTY